MAVEGLLESKIATRGETLYTRNRRAFPKGVRVVHPDNPRQDRGAQFRLTQDQPSASQTPVSTSAKRPSAFHRKPHGRKRDVVLLSGRLLPQGGNCPCLSIFRAN